MLTDFLTRWAIAGCLFLAGLLVGSVAGLRYEQAQRNADQSNIAVAVQKQAAKVAVIQGKQALINSETSHALTSDTAASDAYWRLRVPADRSGSVPIISSHTAGASNDAAQLAASPTGDSSQDGSRTECSPADASADAILAMRWRIWAEQQGRAY